MNITLIRKDTDGAKEKWSVCKLEKWLEKLSKENKDGYISQLRHVLPRLEGSDCHFVNIGRIPRVYPAVTYQRTSNGEHRFKSYNGIVQLEVNRLSGWAEVTAPIDTNITINYEQLYAQAMHEVLHGERYWLDDKDEALLKESNREFEQMSPLEQLFFAHFEAASPSNRMANG